MRESCRAVSCVACAIDFINSYFYFIFSFHSPRTFIYHFCFFFSRPSHTNRAPKSSWLFFFFFFVCVSKPIKLLQTYQQTDYMQNVAFFENHYAKKKSKTNQHWTLFLCAESDRSSNASMNPKCTTIYIINMQRKRKMLEENALTHTQAGTYKHNDDDDRAAKPIDWIKLWKTCFFHRIPCIEWFCRHSIWFVVVVERRCIRFVHFFKSIYYVNSIRTSTKWNASFDRIIIIIEDIEREREKWKNISPFTYESASSTFAWVLIWVRFFGDRPTP